LGTESGGIKAFKLDAFQISRNIVNKKLYLARKKVKTSTSRSILELTGCEYSDESACFIYG
jgi:hypothetical protein